jgi:hypothetical protein
MSASTPDPDPANTPGLEPGGGVAPGDTPPGESSTSGAAFQEPDLPGRRTNWAVYVIIGGVVAVSLLLFVGYAIGLAD